MSNSNKYKCEICKHDYSSYKSRWLHIKKYHKNNEKKITQSTQKNSEEFQCVYCDKILSRSDNLKRHEKTCKKKDEDDIFKDEKIKEAYHKEIEQFKADFFKAMKVHPKTADKINNQISSNNTNSNNTNNGTIINNNINLIIPLGKENFNEVLSLHLNIINCYKSFFLLTTYNVPFFLFKIN